MANIHAFHRVITAFLIINTVNAFNALLDVPTWCGKPYMDTTQSLDPGGQFQFPTPQKGPLLSVTIQPRYSIFLESDGSGDFIVDAVISHLFGQPFSNVAGGNSSSDGETTQSATLDFEIHNGEDGALLVSSSVHVNSARNLFNFSLSSFSPRFEPYPISIKGTVSSGQQNYTGTTQIYVLPSRSYGSAVKIDNVYGGLYVQNAFNKWKGWYAIFPNGYYADGGYVTPSNISFTNLDTYAAQGFNSINIVPDGGRPDQSYPTAELATYWDHMDDINLFNIYDMRFTFQNATRVEEEVARWKNRTTLLMWYTANEPDGWSYPLNSTSIAYTQLRTLDPYHPVSLVLNCQNYYYASYASGADIIFQDAYPVAINATYSIKWNTPCNTTYGDCGCDNCVGELTDVSSRLDDFQKYQENIPSSSGGHGGKKPTWSVLQAFGEQDYWKAIPTAKEVENMMMLSVNHGAKGISYWEYPSTNEVNVGSGALGKVFQEELAIGFLLGADPIKGLNVEGGGQEMADASAWVVGERVLVGVANGKHEDSETTVSVSMPRDMNVSSVKVLYGEMGWRVDDGKLVKRGMRRLEVSVLVLT
ncbi:Uncharacterized protein BP5553_07528 [Venustampulla echinocandica]|uniref:Uncharacterized protein n=1 Tax=Venustampulla echinocandica TaxID=2656787 RepID=A0A370TGU5_9HELO|nr:Uncharacterized protein BP5553_07528 [Venustampulla echinocandica]RDL34400.1 Uncharacterized protein BP5553_07528 [Venustampulla echinocandica]